MKPILRIAIDGPAKAGKSTLANLLAKHYDIRYFSSGVLYRFVGYVMLANNLTEESDWADIQEVIEDGSVEILGNKCVVCYKGETISEDALQREKVSDMASRCSTQKDIRDYVNSCINTLFKGIPIVMDGRDVATTILPDAPIKIYLDTTVDERAKRILKFDNPNSAAHLLAVNNLKERDARDMGRELSPLVQHPEAMYILSDGMSPEVVLGVVVEHIDRVMQAYDC